MHKPPYSSVEEASNAISLQRAGSQPQQVARPVFADELDQLVLDGSQQSLLAIGMRRSYADSCLNSSGGLIDMTGLDRFTEFDPETGRLKAEAGVSLSDILKLVVPHGWFLPTTPGTRFITLGGAIANDVHGKNHHRVGSMGCSVLSLCLVNSDGQRRVIDPQTSPAHFAATIGGLGLTGIIEWVELQLVRIGSAYLEVESVAYDNLDAFWALTEESAISHEHTVAWIDCASRGAASGRGVFIRANWAKDGDYTTHSDTAWTRLPLALPEIAMNRLSIAAANEFYFRLGKMARHQQRRHYTNYFYPLDAIRDWSRLYGRRGLVEYQCVIPFNMERKVLPVLLDEISRSGQASFLGVLKTFGNIPSPGLLSFPRPGTAFASDFPNRGAVTLALMERLDDIVAEAGGALYSAKDGRMPGRMFRQSYPQWRQFMALKDPKMSSDFWRRVSLDD